MNKSLKSQLLSFGFTLVILAISIFGFKQMNVIDYILIGVGVLELIGIVIALVQGKK